MTGFISSAVIAPWGEGFPSGAYDSENSAGGGPLRCFPLVWMGKFENGNSSSGGEGLRDVYCRL